MSIELTPAERREREAKHELREAITKAEDYLAALKQERGYYVALGQDENVKNVDVQIDRAKRAVADARKAAKAGGAI